MAELYLQQWVYLVHGEKQRVSPLAFLDGGLGVCNSPFIYRVGEGFLDPFLGRRIIFIHALKQQLWPSLCRRTSHLHILHGARLCHAQHVEQLQDQLLDVLQGVLLRHEARVDLLLHLNNERTERHEVINGRRDARHRRNICV